MMFTQSWRKTAAVATAATLTLAGCSSGGKTPAGGPAADGGDLIVFALHEPQKHLIPADSLEYQSSQVLSSLWTPLVTFDPETNALEFDGVAESIESQDSTNYTVTLKDGWTFHDGTPITSDSFIDAWNYAANPKNAMSGAYFFENILGYADVAAAKDASATLEGLRKVDDTTFTVELGKPFSQWPLMTGFGPFLPLPESFYADPKAFGANPVGNGPFKAASELEENEGILLEKYQDYAGDNPAQLDYLEYRLITGTDTAYRNVQGGEVDLALVPPAALVTVEEEFDGRVISRDTSSFSYIGFPLYDERFKDKRVRQAFSMAIDREQVAQAIFHGSRPPAHSVVPPMIPGARPDACKYCVHDPDKAKALLAEAGFDTSQPVDLWFNASSGYDDWIPAIGNQWKQTLGVEYTLRGDMPAAEFVVAQDNKQVTGPYRSGWMMNYPSMQNFLEPLFATAAQPPAGSNRTFYSNPEFDALMVEGNEAKDFNEAIAKYQAAEDVVLEDMPIMPVMFSRIQYAHTDRVTGGVMSGFGVVRTELLEPVS